MYPTVSEVLRTAWQENRLAAVHIDLQNVFYHKENVIHRAFENTSNVAHIMREANVHNI